MAVYTEVDHDEADALVRQLGLGALKALRGIEGGESGPGRCIDPSEARFQEPHPRHVLVMSRKAHQDSGEEPVSEDQLAVDVVTAGGDPHRL